MRKCDSGAQSSIFCIIAVLVFPRAPWGLPEPAGTSGGPGSLSGPPGGLSGTSVAPGRPPGGSLGTPGYPRSSVTLVAARRRTNAPPPLDELAQPGI